MGPQCEDGYTKIANELLEALAKVRIPGESMQIFLMILRKTYGYGKREDRIALSQFQETGIGKTHIPRAVAKLVEMKIVTKKGNGYNVTYAINKHHSEWEPLPKKVTLPKKVIAVTEKGNAATQKGNSSNPKRYTQKKKETYTKETIQKKRLAICEAWKSFVEMRAKNKKALTEKAMELAVKKLEDLQQQGYDPVAVLEQSVFNSWQGLFEVKNGNSHRPGNHGSSTAPGRKTGFVPQGGTSEDWLGDAAYLG